MKYLILLAFLEEGQISSSNYGSSDSSSDFLWTPEVFEMLLPGKTQQQVSMCFRDPKDFNQIVVSAEMINDHMPASYQRMISRAKQRFTHQNNAQQDLNPSVWTMLVSLWKYIIICSTKIDGVFIKYCHSSSVHI